jgi:hypothetical protein
MDGSAAAMAVESDRSHRTIVDLYFQVTSGIVSADVVNDQYEIAYRQRIAFRRRYRDEDFAMSAQVGET